MKLNDYKTDYEGASRQLGDINRNLIYTGFGLIWLFGGKGQVLLDYFWPTVFLLFGASFDLIQYFVSTLTWFFEFKRIEKLNPNDYTTEYQHKEELTYPIWAFFWLKIVFVILAYFLIFIELFNKLPI
jgi:hypothetical protein